MVNQLTIIAFEPQSAESLPQDLCLTTNNLRLRSRAAGEPLAQGEKRNDLSTRLTQKRPHSDGYRSRIPCVIGQ
jgi:hypothetical protein